MLRMELCQSWDLNGKEQFRFQIASWRFYSGGSVEWVMQFGVALSMMKKQDEEEEITVVNTVPQSLFVIEYHALIINDPP